MTVKWVIILFSGIAALSVLLSLMKIYRSSRHFTWSAFKNHIAKQTLFTRRTILLTFVFAFLFGLSYLKADSKNSAAVVTLNYGEASKGQNANGTRFNMSEIISDEVLERAIEKGALEGVTAKELEKCLEVYPVMQGSSEKKEDYHIATEFIISYKANKNTKHLDSKTVVQLVANAYKEFYIEHYTDNFSVLDIDVNVQEIMSQLDYLDTVQLLTNQASAVRNYMYALDEKNPSFIASNGETFSSLAEKCTDIIDVQIGDNFESHLLYNGISKNAEDYIGRLNYSDVLADFDKREALASYDIRNQAVAMYSEEMARVVLVPTWDDAGEYYMGRTKVGIDTLSMEAESYSKSAADYSKQIQSNNKIIQALSGSTMQGINEEAENMIVNIEDTISHVAAAAKTASREYASEKMNKCISVSSQDNGLAKCLFIGFVLSGVFFFSLNLFRISIYVEKD